MRMRNCLQSNMTKADRDNSLIGFFNNPKRFNVAITRAKALLLVVGHPGMLKQDKYWRSLVC
jgi:helicase MOV-10